MINVLALYETAVVISRSSVTPCSACCLLRLVLKHNEAAELPFRHINNQYILPLDDMELIACLVWHSTSWDITLNHQLICNFAEHTWTCGLAVWIRRLWGFWKPGGLSECVFRCPRWWRRFWCRSWLLLFFLFGLLPLQFVSFCTQKITLHTLISNLWFQTQWNNKFLHNTIFKQITILNLCAHKFPYLSTYIIKVSYDFKYKLSSILF